MDKLWVWVEGSRSGGQSTADARTNLGCEGGCESCEAGHDGPYRGDDACVCGFFTMGRVFGEKTGSEQRAEDMCSLHPRIYVVGSCYVDLTLHYTLTSTAH